MIRWLFFDLGSTLIDETDCQTEWVRRTVENTAVSFEEFEAAYRRFAAQNLDGYNEACRLFGLSKGKWPVELERLYPGTPELLEKLSEKYSLGVIANQNAGLRERLDSRGIGRRLKVIVGSGDAGMAKPDTGIFKKALCLAGCEPSAAVMIGDRLDNDIAPAQALGMRTVWVRQGHGALGNAALLKSPPDATVDGILEIEFAIDTRINT